MSLRRTTFTDPDGRIKAVLLPEEVPDSEASRGVPIGPPDLSALGWPKDIEVRLHNELFYRGILTPTDALKRRGEIASAIQASLKLDTEAVVVQYLGNDYKIAKPDRKTDQVRPAVTPPPRRRNRRR